MTRLFMAKDFVKIGFGCKISYVNDRTGDIRAYCSICKKWTFFRILRHFDSNGVWKAIFQCKACES